jgi:hypothetical protein
VRARAGVRKCDRAGPCGDHSALVFFLATNVCAAGFDAAKILRFDASKQAFDARADPPP